MLGPHCHPSLASSGVNIFKALSLGWYKLEDHQHLDLKCVCAFVLQEKLWWGWPGPCQGSQCQVPTGCHILLWGKADVAFLPVRGWWQKRWQELTFWVPAPVTSWLWVSSGEGRSSTCLDTIEVAWEDVLWRASIVSVPYSSSSALKPFCAIWFAHPSQWRGRRTSVSRQPILHFAGKAKGLLWRTNLQNGYVGEQKIL